MIAVIGGCREQLRNELKQYGELNWLFDILLRIQHELFNLGSSLATLNEDMSSNMPRITDKNVKNLEKDIDYANESLTSLNSFILPGGNNLNIWLHFARTICRRAERRCVTLERTNAVDKNAIKYLNRLSDALFVWGRWANSILKIEEQVWKPNY